MCSVWNRSHGVRKPSGKHPLDGETFRNKNKEQRTKAGFAIMLRMGRRLVMKMMMRFVRTRQIRDESGDNAAHGEEIGMKSDRL